VGRTERRVMPPMFWDGFAAFAAHSGTHACLFPGYGRSMAKATTPWGRATIVEELRVAQREGERRFQTLVQLLEDEKGGELVRFAYATDGTARRGPVTMRGRDVQRLRAALEGCPRLAGALGLEAGRR
jgi:hypothetical protein